jgi:hypothetical protein
VYLDKLSTILGRPAVIEPLGLTLVYAGRWLRAEGLKGALGLVLCAAILYGLRPAPLIAWPVGGAGLLFALYLGQQVWRRRLRFELDAGGLTRVGGGAAKRIDWQRLEKLRLQFYGQRRRSMQGTLVLTLGVGGVKLKLDSNLEHFPTLLLHAGAAARERGLRLDPTTAANLVALGL